MKKNNLKPTITITLILLLFIIQPASTCTIFSLYPKNQHWVGRTFDWAYGHGLIFTNKRNVAKNGLKLLPSDISGKWISKYGSVTFNQFGREFPTGGMNEAGLVVDALELKSSIFPGIDSRPSLNELQFIQYLLDNYSSIEQITEGLKDIRISPVGSKLHYYTCDPKKCMTIEFINGLLVTHDSLELPISSFANNTYEEHLDYTKDFITFGGTKPIVMDSLLSLDRFTRASYNAKFINTAKDPIKRLFTILNDVGSTNNRWQVIYNQDEKIITFRTTAKIALQRKINLNQFDFNCQEPVYYFDLDSDSEGPINAVFKNYDRAQNFATIKKSVDMQGLPAQLADRLTIYPEETVCH